MPPERLQKVLSNAGIASRRVAEEMILAGRVSVNGQVVDTLGARADPDVDELLLDGVPVTEADFILADDDGVLVVGPERRADLLELAASIFATETAQADRMRGGTDLRTQLNFTEYRRKQEADPTMTLRRHLQDTGSAIET